MNVTFRVSKGMSLRLIVAHVALIALVTVAMVVSLPINNLNS